MKLIKAEVLEMFYERFPHFPHLMRNTDHAYDMNNRSPFHMEGDVWSHTMIAYSHLNIHTDNVLHKYAAAISVLCHDIGKIFTRNSHKENKISFWGHSQASVQHGIDFSFFVAEKLNYTRETRDELIRLVSYAINHHYDIFRYSDDISSYLNYDEDLKSVLYALILADTSGQMKSVDTLNSPDYKDKYFLQQYINPRPIEKEYEKEFFIISGVPGVGKDFIVNKYNIDNIVSYDKIRMRIFGEQNDVDENLSYNDKYRLAFDFTKEMNLNIPLEKELRKISGNVAICNTNLTKKARTAVLNIAKNVYIKEKVKYSCICLVAQTDTILRRNIERGLYDKTLNRIIINKFLLKQSLPTLREGFDDIIFLVNE